MLATVRFGFVPNPFAVAYYAAVQRELFAAEGIRVEETQFANGSAVAEALAAGAIDCGVGGHLQTLEAVLAGHDQVFIGPLAFEERPDHLCICLVAGSVDVGSARDLEGRAVGFSGRGAMSELQLRIFMAAGGADFEHVEIRLMPFGRMSDALRGGEVAAVSVVEPFVSQLVTSGAGTLLDRGSLSNRLPLGERVLITGVVATRRWLAHDGAAAAGIARAIAAGVELVRHDEQAARQMIVAFTGVPFDTAASMQLPAFYPELRAADLQRVFDLAAGFGMVDRVFPADAIIARFD